MSDILTLIQDRRSSRAPYDPERPVALEDVRQILEAARWSPTAHNMQNFHILVIDDKGVLGRLGDIPTRTSEVFLRENFAQLSFSEDELLRKKTGLIGAQFPPAWRTPGARFDEIARDSPAGSLKDTMRDCPLVLIAVHDARQRAPASEGDVLGILSLGCVMENMWLMAHSLGIGFHIMSVFSGTPVEKAVRQTLEIPDYMKISFAARLGYPLPAPFKMLRVRRDVNDFAHHNRFGTKLKSPG
jgi:nitroreductase